MRAVLAVVASVTAPLWLSGCGGGDSTTASPGPTTTPHPTTAQTTTSVPCGPQQLAKDPKETCYTASWGSEPCWDAENRSWCEQNGGVWHWPCGDFNTSTCNSTTAAPDPTLPPDPTAPLSGADIAALMNNEYTSFDKDNSDGSFGVYIRITGSTKVYCHEGCYSGYADCRVSGSVYNPTQIVNQDSGAIEWSYTGTGTDGDFLGIYVNQTLIKQSLGKCAYIGDGGTDNKYNMGCGKHAPCSSNNCDDNTCAFSGMDPDTNFQSPITADSDVVANAFMGSPNCNDPGTCSYRGPAFWKETGFIPDETFQAWKWRAEYDSSAHWNEYVLDGEEVKKALAHNPAGTFPAILYASNYPGGVDAIKAKAKEMAQAFADEWNMAAPVPVIKIDLSVNVKTGGHPFVFEDTASEELVV